MTDTFPVTTRSCVRRRRSLVGAGLVAAAVCLVVLPWSYRAITDVGTTDGSHLNSVGTTTRNTLTTVATSTPRKGDDALTALIHSTNAANRNEEAANRRLLALALGMPGAYLLGARRRLDVAP